MAIKKITEEPVSGSLADDAYLLVTQTEQVDGEDVHALRRVPHGKIFSADAPCVITHAQTGASLDITDAAGGAPEALTVSFASTQSGSGAISPGNLWPITAFTGCTISYSGPDTSDPETETIAFTGGVTLGKGTFDAKTGLLTVYHKYAQITATALAGYSSGYVASSGAFDSKPIVWFRNVFTDAKGRQAGGIEGLCNAFPAKFNATGVSSTQNRFAFCVDGMGITDVAGFIAAVQALETNGSGLFVTYELGTPLTVQLDPVQIALLAGENHIWTDNGSLSIAYIADSGLYLQQMDGAALPWDSGQEYPADTVGDTLHAYDARMDALERPPADVIGANADAVNKIRASRWLREAETDAIPLSLLWFSDIHRWKGPLERIMQFKAYLQAQGLIEGAICTGDLVRNSAAEYTTGTDVFSPFWYDTEGTEDVMIALGNHDHYAQSATPHGRETFANLDDAFFQDADNWGVTREGEYPFYYKDYSAQKIRLIVVDAFVKKSEVNQETWLQKLLYANAGEDDTNTALAKGYAVVIASHYLRNSDTVGAPSATIYDNNWSNNLARAAGTDAMNYEGTDTDIVKVVAEFISRGGKFLCYMLGHTHTDIVSYPTGYPEQLMINCACAATDRGHETRLTTNDLPRWDDTRTADCFNVITFDGKNQTVKCVRVGANVTMYMQPRTAFAYNADAEVHDFISLI